MNIDEKRALAIRREARRIADEEYERACVAAFRDFDEDARIDAQIEAAYQAREAAIYAADCAFNDATSWVLPFHNAA